MGSLLLPKSNPRSPSGPASWLCFPCALHSRSTWFPEVTLITAGVWGLQGLSFNTILHEGINATHRKPPVAFGHSLETAGSSGKLQRGQHPAPRAAHLTVAGTGPRGKPTGMPFSLHLCLHLYSGPRRIFPLPGGTARREQAPRQTASWALRATARQ